VTIGPDGTVRRRVIVGYGHFLRLARRVQWDEAEIDLGPDARAWPEAGDDVAAELLAGFCVGESGVAEWLAPFAAAAEPPVAECFAAQERDERRHARFFARAWDTVVGGDPRERLKPEFLDLFEVRLPQAAAGAADAFAGAVGLYHMILEGVVFTAGQYALLERLDERLPGLRRGTELVLRDERWHIGFGTRCLMDAGLTPEEERAILAEGEAAAAVWAPEQAERVVLTLRRRLQQVR
jgi:ribonucleoside-diphosphate reductase beta chain